MRLTPFLALLFTATPALAQTTYLSEDFNAGVVPPAGWTHVNNNSNPAVQGWISDGSRAWCEDEFGVGQADITLVSPAFDLSSATAAYLHFDGETNWATYLANHPNSFGNGISNMEISTDGGLNWDVVWTDTSQNNGDTYSPTVDLSAYLGFPSVQVGLHFSGDYAQEWWVDNVIVDDTPVPVLSSQINPNNGHPYFLLGQSDFATAQAMAISLGGSLTTVSDFSENNWIQTTFGNFGGTQRNLMIGLTDEALEGTFTWISGEGEPYRNWAAGEPNNGGSSGEDYVEINSAGTWNDFDGLSGFGVVEISQPRISATPLVAGQATTITVTGLRTDSSIILVFSVNGNGPTNTPYGVLEVDADLISPSFPSQGGQFNFTTYIPSNLAGRTLYGQGIQFNTDQTTDLSEAFAEVIL